MANRVSTYAGEDGMRESGKRREADVCVCVCVCGRGGWRDGGAWGGGGGGHGPFLRWYHLKPQIHWFWVQRKVRPLHCCFDADFIGGPVLMQTSLAVLTHILPLHCCFDIQTSLAVLFSLAVLTHILPLHCCFDIQTSLAVLFSLAVLTHILPLHCCFDIQTSLVVLFSLAVLTHILPLHCCFDIQTSLVVLFSLAVLTHILPLYCCLIYRLHWRSCFHWRSSHTFYLYTAVLIYRLHWRSPHTFYLYTAVLMQTDFIGGPHTHSTSTLLFWYTDFIGGPHTHSTSTLLFWCRQTSLAVPTHILPLHCCFDADRLQWRSPHTFYLYTAVLMQTDFIGGPHTHSTSTLLFWCRQTSLVVLTHILPLHCCFDADRLHWRSPHTFYLYTAVLMQTDFIGGPHTHSTSTLLFWCRLHWRSSHTFYLYTAVLMQTSLAVLTHILHKSPLPFLGTAAAILEIKMLLN